MQLTAKLSVNAMTNFSIKQPGDDTNFASPGGSTRKRLAPLQPNDKWLARTDSGLRKKGVVESCAGPEEMPDLRYLLSISSEGTSTPTKSPSSAEPRAQLGKEAPWSGQTSFYAGHSSPRSSSSSTVVPQPPLPTPAASLDSTAPAAQHPSFATKSSASPSSSSHVSTDSRRHDQPLAEAALVGDGRNCCGIES